MGTPRPHDQREDHRQWQCRDYKLAERNVSRAAGEDRHDPEPEPGIPGRAAPRYNYFEIALLEVPGRQNWSIEYKTPILGFGQTGWQIDTDDAALRDRLLVYGVIDEIARMRPEEISYQARAKTLLFSEDVTPRWVPTPGAVSGGVGVVAAAGEGQWGGEPVVSVDSDSTETK